MTNQRYNEVAELIPRLGTETQGRVIVALKFRGVSEAEANEWCHHNQVGTFDIL